MAYGGQCPIGTTDISWEYLVWDEDLEEEVDKSDKINFKCLEEELDEDILNSGLPVVVVIGASGQ